MTLSQAIRDLQAQKKLARTSENYKALQAHCDAVSRAPYYPESHVSQPTSDMGVLAGAIVGSAAFIAMMGMMLLQLPVWR